MEWLLAVCALAVLALLAGLALGAWGARRLGAGQRESLAAAELRLRAAVQEMSTTALRENSDLFLKLAHESFGERAAQLGAAERERREAFGSLRAQLESLALSQGALQRETRSLVTALRRPEVRGRWGETTLRRVMELAGMSEHCDFTEQAVLAPNEAGAAQRPDVLVHLPEGRTVVIDAKAPLDAYLSATEAGTPEERAAALTRHAVQVEARVRELSTKAYWTQLPGSPEFVVLFVPGEQFLSAALAERADLLDQALRSNVILATPASLMALLKVIAFAWRQRAVADNATQIQSQGQQLFRRLGIFATHLSKNARALRALIEAHNAAVGSFERQLLPAATRFAELGAADREALAALEVPEAIAPHVREPAGEPPADTP